MLINSSQVKNFFKSKGVRSSAEVLNRIDEEVKKICLKTTDNTLAKKLKTAKGKDVPKLDPLLSSSHLHDLKS